MAWAVDNDFQLWPELVLKVPISEKNYMTVLATPRFGDNATELSQFITPRIGFFHRWNSHITTGLSAEYFQVLKPTDIKELRLAGTVLLQHKLLKVPVTHRLRVEQRWRKGARSTVIRLRLKNRIEKDLGDGPWYLVGFNEVFINLNSSRGNAQAGLEQNRSFLGLGRRFKINEKSVAKAEAGYQLMYFNRPAPLEGSFFHVILVKLVLTPF